MASNLTGEYIPRDELVPPKRLDEIELRGAVTDFNFLSGGFVFAHAVFGVTDTVENLFVRRISPLKNSKSLYPGVELTGLVSEGSAMFGNFTVDAMLRVGSYNDDENAPVLPGWVSEIAGKMACVSLLLDKRTPLFTTTYQIRDGELAPAYTLQPVMYSSLDISVPVSNTATLVSAGSPR